MTDIELLREIEPSLERAYTEHMESIGDRRPFSTVGALAAAAGTDTDPLTYGKVLRTEHEEHMNSTVEQLGVDFRPLLAASFFVNLLTEDNLPHYTSRIHSKVYESPALSTFANEWTAEEATHGILMRDYALMTGIIGDQETSAISHAEYEAGRTQQLRTGTEINPSNLQNAFAYLTLQELLTKEAHNKQSWTLAPSGRKIMRPISGDEHNHYEFYRKSSEASLEADPDGTLIEMQTVYGQFSMPGRIGIPVFDEHAFTIGISGIFDLETITRAKQQIVARLGIEHVRPASDQAKAAQEALLEATTDRAVDKDKRTMERLRESAPTELDNGLAPFILGKTVEFTYSGAPGYERATGLQRIA